MLDIGIASYQNPEMLQRSIAAIQQHTVGDFALLVVDNASPDPAVRQILETASANDSRITVEFRDTNIGYVGAVNRILEWATAQHVAYVDNDAIINTPGWNAIMETSLLNHPEVGMVFPTKFCAYPLQRQGYKEVLWGLGCFWMLSTARAREVGPWDDTLGHQEEADFTMRLRLAGWKIAGADIDVTHQGKASADPAAQARISNGVINWMNKWLRYFVGPGVTYFSANVQRFEDWPINSLHIEQWFHAEQEAGRLPVMNTNPQQVTLGGRTYDLVMVPRLANLYRSRLV